MKKQQLILFCGGLALILLLFFFGETVPPKTAIPQETAGSQPAAFTTEDILTAAKKDLNPVQATNIAQLENAVVRGDVKEQQIEVYKKLARYWSDSLHHPEIAAYYLGEKGKLENSEKTSISLPVCYWVN